MKLATFVCVCAVFATTTIAATDAHADAPKLTDAQQDEMEQLRLQAASAIQLRAYDLLDELVEGWNEKPVFGVDTPVVLAGVTVPVGFGSGLEALIETHFSGLVVKNPNTHVKLAYCPQCSALLVHSGPKGTIVSRGIDQPGVLKEAGVATAALHAIFLDFEAEGSALVLRARITSLDDNLTIVAARTISTTTTSAALLRTGEPVKSAAQAHDEYVADLEGKGPIVIPMSIGVRNFAAPASTDLNGNANAALPPIPQVWIEGGAEIALTQARAWTASLQLGVTWFPAVQTGGLIQARISRLFSGDASSLTNPDIYGFVGGAITVLQGAGALSFRDKTPNVADLLQAATGSSNPQTIWGSAQAGLTLRVKNRIAISVYAEAAPTLGTASGIGNYVDLGITKVQSVGGEVSFCF